MRTLKTLYPVYCSGKAISHICLSLCEHMRTGGWDAQLLVPASDPQGRRVFTRDAIWPPLRKLAYRLDQGRHRIQALTERKYLRWLAPGDIAYLWPGVSLAVYEQVKRRGHMLVMERINCHRATSRRILEEAYGRLGWPPDHGIDERDIALEQHKLELADFVFSPSPPVTRSLVAAGVPPHKILPASYGWDPQRLGGGNRSLPPDAGLTVLFVGYFCVRKGAPLLLQAWEQAGIRGRLVIAGRIAPDVARHCAAQLRRPDVLHLDHCDDIGPVYRSADVFAFPTLEEGSPLVSYEALANGLPLLISPMGAGEVVRADREGLIREAYDTAAWVQALRGMAADASLRAALGRAARARAAEYTWDCVAARRAAALAQALASPPDPAADEDHADRHIHAAASR